MRNEPQVEVIRKWVARQARHEVDNIVTNLLCAIRDGTLVNCTFGYEYEEGWFTGRHLAGFNEVHAPHWTCLRPAIKDLFGGVIPPIDIRDFNELER